MRDRMPAEAAHTLVEQDIPRIESVIDGPLTGHLVNGRQDRNQILRKRFFFHAATLCNK
jgi:hypothetical protein